MFCALLPSSASSSHTVRITTSQGRKIKVGEVFRLSGHWSSKGSLLTYRLRKLT